MEVRRNFSRDVAKDWTRPIRLLWIDGDHSYQGCKEDFDLFSPFLSYVSVIGIQSAKDFHQQIARTILE